MANGLWQMAFGRWLMADGLWQMAYGRWQNTISTNNGPYAMCHRPLADLLLMAYGKGYLRWTDRYPPLFPTQCPFLRFRHPANIMDQDRIQARHQNLKINHITIAIHERGILVKTEKLVVMRE